jgi:hypothetical protein
MGVGKPTLSCCAVDTRRKTREGAFGSMKTGLKWMQRVYEESYFPSYLRRLNEGKSGEEKRSVKILDRAKRIVHN